MKRWSLAGALLGMLLLVLDSRCAAESARSAIDLCIRTVIPSLFPMFVLSGLLVSGLGGRRSRLLSALERAYGLPSGGGSLFLLGLLGGFPVGAQCIVQAVEDGRLSRENAQRMLGFCNNCSPGFLFGILGSIFGDPMAPLFIFLIQLASALTVAGFTDFRREDVGIMPARSVTLTEAVSRAIRSMASVCAWVVLAGVVTGFLKRWLFPLLPEPMPVILSGLLEVTGGVLGLAEVADERLRFVLCGLFVCFGGFSVWMQIHSLVSAKGLSTAQCFRQKTLQGLIGGFLALGVAALGIWVAAIGALLPLIRKKRLENPSHNVYNGSRKGGLDHVVP